MVIRARAPYVYGAMKGDMVHWSHQNSPVRLFYVGTASQDGLRMRLMNMYSDATLANNRRSNCCSERRASIRFACTGSACSWRDPGLDDNPWGENESTPDLAHTWSIVQVTTITLKIGTPTILDNARMWRILLYFYLSPLCCGSDFKKTSKVDNQAPVMDWMPKNSRPSICPRIHDSWPSNILRDEIPKEYDNWWRGR